MLSNNTLMELIDELPVALFCKDIQNDYRFVIWNKKAEDIFGIPQSEILGKTDFDFFPHEHASFFRKKDIETARAQKLEIDREDCETSKGKFVLNTKKVVICEDGQPKYLMGISEDITAKVQNEKTIEEQRTHLIQSERLAAVGQMSAGIAHEINNPLAIIKISAELLQKLYNSNPKSDVKTEKLVSNISSTVDRIAKIIKGLRTFAVEGKNDSFTKVKVKDIVSETLDLCSEHFRDKGVQIVTEGLDDETTIECVSVQISQVLLNLLNNSFDAIRDTQNPFIKINAQKNKQSIKLEVIDSGLGIDPTIANKVLEPFFTTKKIGLGTGLGLSIARGIALAHNGQLYLDESKKNTTFVLELPLIQKAENKS